MEFAKRQQRSVQGLLTSLPTLRSETTLSFKVESLRFHDLSLRFGVRIYVYREVGVAGKHFDVPQRAANHGDLSCGGGDESPPAAVAGADAEAEVGIQAKGSGGC